MERIQRLNWYQRGVLIAMTVMVLFFAVIYSITIEREGFLYEDVILTQNQENENTIYSGKIKGEQASFIVYADKTVEFKYGDKTYGPYTVKDDPTAIPEDSEMGDDIAGVELFDGDKIIFRGGVLHQGDNTLLFNEDGSLENIGFSVITSNGIEIDENGVAIDPMEPSISDILNLVSGPEITHKGEWFAWVGGVFICMVTAISILFADELFRFKIGRASCRERV